MARGRITRSSRKAELLARQREEVDEGNGQLTSVPASPTQDAAEPIPDDRLQPEADVEPEGDVGNETFHSLPGDGPPRPLSVERDSAVDFVARNGMEMHRVQLMSLEDEVRTMRDGMRAMTDRLGRVGEGVERMDSRMNRILTALESQQSAMRPRGGDLQSADESHSSRTTITRKTPLAAQVNKPDIDRDVPPHMGRRTVDTTPRASQRPIQPRFPGDGEGDDLYDDAPAPGDAAEDNGSHRAGSGNRESRTPHPEGGNQRRSQRSGSHRSGSRQGHPPAGRGRNGPPGGDPSDDSSSSSSDEGSRRDRDRRDSSDDSDSEADSDSTAGPGSRRSSRRSARRERRRHHRRSRSRRRHRHRHRSRSPTPRRRRADNPARPQSGTPGSRATDNHPGVGQNFQRYARMYPNPQPYVLPPGRTFNEQLALERSLKARDPDPFDGKDPDKLPTFLSQCSMVFQMRPCTYQDVRSRIMFAVTHLTDGALTHFETQLATPLQNQAQYLRDWEHFVERLQLFFGRADPVAHAENKITKLEMGSGRSAFSAYLVKFQSLAGQIDWNDDPLRNAFLRGLAPWLRLAIQRYPNGPAKNLTKLIDQCSKQDSLHWDFEDEKAEREVRNSARRHAQMATSRPSRPEPSGSGARRTPTSNPPMRPRRSSGERRRPADRSKSTAPPGDIGPDGKLKADVLQNRRDKGLCLYCGGNHDRDNCPQLALKDRAGFRSGRAAHVEGDESDDEDATSDDGHDVAGDRSSEDESERDASGNDDADQ